jgi:cytochrome b subunit of formate dehydrogenase
MEEQQQSENEKPKKLTRKERHQEKQKKAIRHHTKWFIFIITFAFAMAFVFGLVVETAFGPSSIAVCALIIFMLILIAFTGDIFAVAGAYADISIFNSMAARRIKGARQAIHLVKHSDKVSSILSDVLGDVCAIVSGAAGVYLALMIIGDGDFSLFQKGLIVATVNAAIAALAVTAKSAAKKIAIKNSTAIVLLFGKILAKVGFKK